MTLKVALEGQNISWYTSYLIVLCGMADSESECWLNKQALKKTLGRIFVIQPAGDDY